MASSSLSDGLGSGGSADLSGDSLESSQNSGRSIGLQANPGPGGSLRPRQNPWLRSRSFISNSSSLSPLMRASRSTPLTPDFRTRQAEGYLRSPPVRPRRTASLGSLMSQCRSSSLARKRVTQITEQSSSIPLPPLPAGPFSPRPRTSTNASLAEIIASESISPTVDRRASYSLRHREIICRNFHPAVTVIEFLGMANASVFLAAGPSVATGVPLGLAHYFLHCLTPRAQSFPKDYPQKRRWTEIDEDNLQELILWHRFAENVCDILDKIGLKDSLSKPVAKKFMDAFRGFDLALGAAVHARELSIGKNFFRFRNRALRVFPATGMVVLPQEAANSVPPFEQSAEKMDPEHIKQISKSSKRRRRRRLLEVSRLVEVVRTQGQPWGLDVVFGTDGLHVSGICSSGVFALWNEANPESKVNIGDVIVTINSERVSARRLAQRLTQETSIIAMVRPPEEVVLKRGSGFVSALAHSAGPGTIQGASV